MIPSTSARFDESVALVARDLHVTGLTVAALALAAALFLWLERRFRARWSVVPVVTRVTREGPCRSSDVVSAHLPRAPRLVRVASFCSLAFGHLFAPLVVLALSKYPSDGISIALVPGMALALLDWCCATMLLRRSRLAVPVMRSGAVGSLLVNVGLLAISGAHLLVVELDRYDRVEHACSPTVTFVVLLFAVCSIALAVLMTAALRVHERALTWAPSPAPEIRASRSPFRGRTGGPEEA